MASGREKKGSSIVSIFNRISQPDPDLSTEIVNQVVTICTKIKRFSGVKKEEISAILLLLENLLECIKDTTVKKSIHDSIVEECNSKFTSLQKAFYCERDTYQDSFDAQEIEHSELKKANTSLENEKKELKTKLSLLHEEKSEETNTKEIINGLQKQVTKLSKKNESIEKENKELNSKLSLLSDQNSKVTNLKQLVNDLQNQVSKITKENKELHRQINKINTEKNKTLQEQKRIENETRKAINALEKEKEKLHNRLESQIFERKNIEKKSLKTETELINKIKEKDRIIKEYYEADYLSAQILYNLRVNMGALEEEKRILAEQVRQLNHDLAEKDKLSKMYIQKMNILIKELQKQLYSIKRHMNDTSLEEILMREVMKFSALLQVKDEERFLMEQHLYRRCHENFVLNRTALKVNVLNLRTDTFKLNKRREKTSSEQLPVKNTKNEIFFRDSFHGFFNNALHKNVSLQSDENIFQEDINNLCMKCNLLPVSKENKFYCEICKILPYELFWQSQASMSFQDFMMKPEGDTQFQKIMTLEGNMYDPYEDLMDSDPCESWYLECPKNILISLEIIEIIESHNFKRLLYSVSENTIVYF